jgi:hypothetical protein
LTCLTRAKCLKNITSFNTDDIKAFTNIKSAVDVFTSALISGEVDWEVVDMDEDEEMLSI